MIPGPLCLPIGSGRRPSRGRCSSTAFSMKRGRLFSLFFLVLGIAVFGASQARATSLEEGGQGKTKGVETASAEHPDTTAVTVGGGDASGLLAMRTGKAGKASRRLASEPAEAPVVEESSAAAPVESADALQHSADALGVKDLDEATDADVVPPLEPEAAGAVAAAATEPPPEPAEAAGAQSTAAAQVEQAASGPRFREMGGVREVIGDGYTRIIFKGILGEEGYKYSFLEDPPRLVIDVKQPSQSPPFTRFSLEGEAFLRLRVGKYPDRTRLVLDYRTAGIPKPKVLAADGDLVVQVGEAPVATPAPVAMGGPETPTEAPGAGEKAEWRPVRVEAIDFHPTDSSSDILISTDRPTPYDVREEAEAIVIVLPGASIPARLRRPLDTSAFPTAVSEVVPEQKGSGPTGQAVVTIRLRKKRPYNVIQEEKGIRVSVLLPEEAPEIALLPPPEIPEVQPAELKPAEKPKAAAANPPAQAVPAKVTKPAPKAPAPRVRAPSGPRTVPLATRPLLSRKKYKGRKISLDFKDADIQNVLRLIAEVSGLNIVISDAVTGKVTIRLKDIPWDMAFDVILKTYALDKEYLGPNILRVAPYTQLKKEREDALKAEEARNRVEELATRVVPVNYAKAENLKSLLGQLKSKRPDATILVDSRTNSLILKDLQENIDEMVKLIHELDTQTPQVLIEAKIVELDVEFEQELGIQWGTSYQAGPATGNPTGLNFPHTASVGGVVDKISGETVPGIANPVVNLPAAVDSNAGGALGFSLASITNSFQLDAQLSALEKRKHARILSSPRVATLSNQEARIEQGQEVPYQTTSDEGTKTEFKDAKLRLSVTPQITFDQSIIMNIVVTNDTPIRDPTVGFIIGKKEAQTAVLVKNGETAVIGGIFTNNDSNSTGGVPWFMDLPVAGVLFKKKADAVKRTELIIFITPRIIPTERPAHSVEWVK